MIKNLILLILSCVIIFQKINAIEVFNINNRNVTTFSNFNFTEYFKFEFIFRLTEINYERNFFVIDDINKTNYIFSIHSPFHSIGVQTKKYKNAIDLIYDGKIVTFYNNKIFDRKKHKIVFHYESGSARISIDCSEFTSLRKLRSLDKVIEYSSEPIRKMEDTFYHIGYDVALFEFILYDNLLSSGSNNCDDINETINTTKSLPNFVDKPDCVLSETLVRGRQVCKGELIFEDNFDIFNRTKWEHEIRMPLDIDDAEFVSYQDYQENCFINASNLNIKPTLLSEVVGYNEYTIRTGELNLGSKCTVVMNDKIECIRKARFYQILPPIISAKIRTRNSFSFRYGRIDVRAKLPKGDWIFPQIHLEPLISDYGTGSYKSGQMRIAYIRGNEVLIDENLTKIDGSRLSGGVVLQVGELLRDRWMQNSLQSEHMGNNYHVYSMIWTNESITLLLDEVTYGVVGGGFKNIETIPHAQLWKRGEFMAPFDKEFYISLGVSVGGISDFPDASQNGVDRKRKPWTNFRSKSEYKFWQNRRTWKRTWNTDNVGMKIDYVKVWAL